MSDALKHECAVAMVRLRKDLSYYKSKYGIENFKIEELEFVEDNSLLSEKEIYWINEL